MVLLCCVGAAFPTATWTVVVSLLLIAPVPILSLRIDS